MLATVVCSETPFGKSFYSNGNRNPIEISQLICVAKILKMTDEVK